MTDKVFSMLWRNEANLKIVKSQINIKFVQNAYKEVFKKTRRHDATQVLKYVLTMLSAELVPQDLVQRVMSFQRQNEDIMAYQKIGVVNKLFSLLLAKHFECPKGHKSTVATTSIGLNLRRPEKGETLKDLI